MAIHQTVQETVSQLKELFEQSDIHFGQGTESALDEAAYLVSFVTGLPPDFAGESYQIPVLQKQVQAIFELAHRRIQTRQPLAYLLGTTWYRGYPFKVNPKTLIPRSPIGELIEQQFAPWIHTNQVRQVLDLCCGGGSLGILTALYFPDAHVDLVDIDRECIHLSSENSRLNAVENRAHVIQSDLFEQVPQKRYDIIVTNPPYIPLAQQAELPAEFQHEPSGALYAGTDGLDFARIILTRAADYLTPHGILILEVGEMSAALEEAFPQHLFMWAELEQGGEGVCIVDYSGCKALLGA